MLLCAVSYIFWHFKLDLIGMTIFAIVFMVVLCFSKDGTPAIPNLLMYLLTISSNYDSEFIEDNFVLLLVQVIGAVGSICVYVNRTGKKVFFGKQTLGFVLMMVAMLIGGIGYNTSLTLRSIPSVLTIYLAMIGGYLLFGTLVKKVDPEYFARIMTYVGVLLALQTLDVYLFSEYDFFTTIQEKLIRYGWGLSNSAGALLLLTIPFTLYLVTKSDRPVAYYLLFVCQVVTLVMTISRGAVLMGVVGIPILLIVAAERAKSPKTVITMLVYTILFALVAVFLMWDKITVIINRIAIASSNGRFMLYEEAISDFLKSPIFGVSMYGRDSIVETNMFLVYWYHSTPLQFMANAGLLGLGAYLVHLAIKYKMLLAKGDFINKFILGGILMWSAYALIDVLYFSQNQILFFVLTLVFAEKNVYNRIDCRKNRQKNKN